MTPHKWLNFESLCAKLRPDDKILKIKYFTSLVFGRDQQARQLRFLQALGTISTFESHMGTFTNKTLHCRHAGCSYDGRREYQTVVEKRTDVNIAVSMVRDAFEDACDVFAVISGDSDLVAAVHQVKAMKKKVVVYVPVRPDDENANDRRADELKHAATSGRDIPFALVKSSQFGDIVSGNDRRPIAKPVEWCD